MEGIWDPLNISLVKPTGGGVSQPESDPQILISLKDALRYGELDEFVSQPALTYEHVVLKHEDVKGE